MSKLRLAMLSEATFTGKVDSIQHNIFDWVHVFDGDHYPYTEIIGHYDKLDNYDVVLLGDADRRLVDAASIARACKAKTIFYPEGTTHAYTSLPFDHQRMFMDLLSVVDLIGAVEEDRIQWYEAICDTPVFFMHVPIGDDLINGRYKRKDKREHILVGCNLGMDEIRYKTNLITSLGVLRKTGKHAVLCEVLPNQVWFYKENMGANIIAYTSRINLHNFLLQLVAPSKIMLSPSYIIGTSRNAIAGAACGTPIIGNRDSHTQRRLWPELSVYINDAKGMIDIIYRLYENENFYHNICDRAFEELQFYSIENSKKRFIEAVERVN